MQKQNKKRFSLIKVICICLILVLLSGVGVMAVTTQMSSVKITLTNGYEMTVLTSKTNVQDNNIVLENNETVTPSLEEDITASKKITISDKSKQQVEVAKISESGVETTLDSILGAYSQITEKIVEEEEAIPFETITKDVSNGSNTVNKVIQAGKNGIKEVTYKVRYKGDVEVERIELSSKVIKEPVNKIVQIQTVTSRSTSRGAGVTTASSGRYKVTAYCSCARCCGKTNGVTASGKRATANHTVAAPSTFAFGTQMVINGKTYVVEDRGGAIQGNRIDVYMNSHAEAIAWGVRYLDVEVIK
mgnify:CR=1 FL=1